MLRLSDREMKAGDEPDVWQWAKLTPIDPQPFIWNFDLPDIESRRRGSAVRRHLTIWIFAAYRALLRRTTPTKPVDHVVEVSINGKALPPQSWDGRDEVTRELDVPLRIAQGQGQQHQPARAAARPRRRSGNFIVDVVMFNWFARRLSGARRHRRRHGAFVDQRRRHRSSSNTTAPAAPRTVRRRRRLSRRGSRRQGPLARSRSMAATSTCIAVAGERMLKPDARARRSPMTTCAKPTPGFDYLMVAHPRLLDAIQPLAQYHRDARPAASKSPTSMPSTTSSTAASRIRVAIRNLVEWGTQHWQVKPRYLLLVGDASADIHHDVRIERLNPSAIALRPDPLHEEMMQQGALVEHADDVVYANGIPSCRTAT